MEENSKKCEKLNKIFMGKYTPNIRKDEIEKLSQKAQSENKANLYEYFNRLKEDINIKSNEEINSSKKKIFNKSMIEKGDGIIQSMFSVVGNLARLFFRVNDQNILNCVECTKSIVKERYLGDSFLTQMIIEADNRGDSDRFWMIWNAYRDLLPELLKWGNSQQLRTYLLNIQWKDGVKEWLCLRQGDIGFFDYVAENSSGKAKVLECIAKDLTNIANNYQTEGMGWISKIVLNHPSVNLAETSALFYLEQVMMEYVYANKMKIRKTPELHAQVRAVLNFMVSKSSVTGFVLRDMVN